MRDRSFENQHHRASGLNLLVAVITLWNTVYLERAVTLLNKSQIVERILPQQVSPLGWKHIVLTGLVHHSSVLPQGFSELPLS